MTKLVSNETLFIGAFILVAFEFGIHIKTQCFQVSWLKSKFRKHIPQLLCFLC